MRIGRIVVILFAAFFGTLGLGFWVAPDRAARHLSIEALGGPGLATLRADLGGSLVGLALLCLLGALLKRRSLLMAAALVLLAIATGRLAAVGAEGGGRAQIAPLAIEVGAVVALFLYARGLRAGARPVAAGATRGRIVTAGVVLAAGAGIMLALLHPAVEQRIFERAVTRLTARDGSGLLDDDALRVAICGSSAPLPSAARAKACVAVFAGGRFYVVDVGPESVENLVQWGIPLARIGGVLITHFHSDHIGDLGELNLQTWAQGRQGPLAVHGGPGVEQVVDGFNQAYRQDQGYRTAHHTERLMPAAAWPLVAHPVEMTGPPTPEKSRSGLVLDDGGLRITAIEVDHAPIAPAYAYRFDYKGRSAVVTGDFKFHLPLAESAQGADVLVSEAIARPMVEALEASAAAAGRDRQAAIMHDIQDYHVSPLEAADIANRAGVGLLVFYHLLPAPDALLTRRLFAHDVGGARRGDWVIADDGSLYTLPLGSREIRIGRTL